MSVLQSPPSQTSDPELRHGRAGQGGDMEEPITRQHDRELVTGWSDPKRELRRTNTEYVLMALAGFILGWTVHHLVGTYFSSWLSASLVFAIAAALLVVFFLQLD